MKCHISHPYAGDLSYKPVADDEIRGMHLLFWIFNAVFTSEIRGESESVVDLWEDLQAKMSVARGPKMLSSAAKTFHRINASDIL